MEDNREKELKRGSVVNVSNPPFWNFNKQLAVSAAIATLAFQPVDIVKVRTQLGQTQVIRSMVMNEGFRSFYKGLSAAVPRQAVFTMVGLESYKAFLARILLAKKKPLSRYEHLSCVVTAGAVAACISSPAELILTRMQADASLLSHQRKNYANAFHAFYRIVMDEGFVALWKGGSPTVMRTIANTAGIYSVALVFAPFIIFKPNRVSQRPNKVTQELALHGFLITGGILPAALSKPFDYVRTQLQMMQPDARGKYPYSGPLDCAMKTFKSRGLLKFYVGFQAYALTCLPHILVTIAILKQLQQHNIYITLKY